MSDEAMWKKLDKLQEQFNETDKVIAVVMNEQQRQRDQNDKIIESMATLAGKMDALRDDVMQARGALRLGHWLAGLLATTGAGAALLAWFSKGAS